LQKINNKTYHLHVPRTSGTNILYELHKSIGSYVGENKPSIYKVGMFDFVHDKSKTEDSDIISGHFGLNPIYDYPGIDVFCLIRNPIEQFISTAAYFAMSGRHEFDHSFLDRFIDGEMLIDSRFEGMSGVENPQSAFISSKIADIDVHGNPPDWNNAIFINPPKSYSDVEQHLEGMIIGTLENRVEFIERVNSLLFKKHGIKIPNNIQKVNSSNRLEIEPTKSQIEKIWDLTQIDQELYAKIREKELARI